MILVCFRLLFRKLSTVSLGAADGWLGMGCPEAMMELSGSEALGGADGFDVWPDFPMRSLACFLQDTRFSFSTKHSNQSIGLGT